MDFILNHWELFLLIIGFLFFISKPFLSTKIPKPAMRIIESLVYKFMQEAEEKYQSGNDKKQFVKSQLGDLSNNNSIDGFSLSKFLVSDKIDEMIETLHEQNFKIKERKDESTD